MLVKHNLSAMNNERFLGIVTDKEAKRSEKLVSGYRINRAGDDAAGLAISEKMRRQIRGLTQASANAQDGISLLQSAEGALHEVHGMLQRMNELAVQAANGTNSDEDRAHLQKEVAQIITEVDRVANTTRFNEMTLLDGSCGRRQIQPSSADSNTAPSVRVTNEVSYQSVTTTQITDNYWAAGDDYEEIKTMLENQMVPQAIQALLNTFSNTFGYLQGSSIGMGVRVYEDENDTAVAFVSLKTSYDSSDTPPKVWLEYQLGVNIGRIGKDTATGQITADGREYLEATIVHEMMHALMDEALTCGMIDRDVNMMYQEGFPNWFVEGTAQAAGGGVGWVRNGLQIDGNSDEAAIQSALSTHYLGKTGDNTYAADYGTGYLAVMYLGHLVHGGTSMEEADIAEGLDILLNEIRGGKSLSQVIADHTGYTGLDDFEAKFAADGVSFSKQLLALTALSSTDYGRGALVTGNYQQTDLLEDVDTPEDVFDLNTGYLWVENEYPEDYVVMSGGTAYGSGIEGPDYVPATSGGGGSTIDPTDPDAGGGTTDPTDPDAGGGTTTPTDPDAGGGGSTTGPTDPDAGGTGTNPGGGGTTPGGTGTTIPGGSGGGTGSTYGGGLSLHVEQSRDRGLLCI